MSGEPDLAARRFLTRALSDAMGSVPSVRLAGGGVYVSGAAGNEPESDPQPHGDGAVAAFEALGVLGEGEVARWRERFRLGRDGGGEVPAATADEADGAARHLEALFEAVAAAGSDADRAAALDRFGGAFSLLIRLGYLDHGAVERWAERLDGVSGLRADELEYVDETAGAPEELGEHLVTIAAPPARHGGTAVTAVELYSGGFVVHWHLVLDGSAAGDDGFPAPALTAADDAGTAYGPLRTRGASYSPGDGPYAVFGSSAASTAPPAGAGTLTVGSESGGEWTVALPGDRRGAEPAA